MWLIIYELLYITVYLYNIFVSFWCYTYIDHKRVLYITIGLRFRGMQSTSVPQFIPTPYACTRGPYNDFYTMYWEEIAGFSCSPTKPKNPMEYLFSHTNKMKIKINPAKICWDKDTHTVSPVHCYCIYIALHYTNKRICYERKIWRIHSWRY